MKDIGNILSKYQLKQSKGYVTREFQDYGYRLALEMEDASHVGMYIKLAKNTNRSLLEQARSFVLDAKTARSKGRLFMWKLKQLRDIKK